ncbi:GIY-YIG nuclease family protein [Candidatus Poseidoniaceae archaeon]|nr:GIY-YIG nuclease family protein [Candidatus Poseidoniaceae archaeon]
MESEEQDLPTRNTDWLRVRGEFQPVQIDDSVGSGVHEATASSQGGIGLAAPIGQQTVPLLPSEEIQSHLPELPAANPHHLDEPNTTSTSGFLYFIENPSFPGWIKVGRGSTVTRYEAYNTGDPHRGYRLIAETPVSGNLGELERELHILISQSATARGVSSASSRLSEWFEIPVDVAVSILVDRYPSAFIHSAN